jgi:abortive infection bacteriophage resistance protein
MTNYQPLKPALSVQDQIILLKQRGMVFLDDHFAEDFLLHNNYYRLNIYFHKFMDSTNHLIYGTKFEQITSIYENDRWLHSFLISLLEPIEIAIKTGIAYHLGLSYGSDCFYTQEIYSNAEIWLNIQKSFQREVNYQINDPVIRHHQTKYGKYPIWVVVEYLSFNSISKYYSNLLLIDQKVISSDTFGVNEAYLSSWLHSLSVLRNICAHYGYLYQRDFSIKPKFPKNTAVNKRLFSLLFAIRELVSPQTWNQSIEKIRLRHEEISDFVLSEYGFPNNWYSLPPVYHRKMSRS